MLAVVIPAYNEEARIGGILAQVLRLKVDLVIPVLNGCTDRTLEIVRGIEDPRVWPLFYEEQLGLDVPRIAGARLALQKGAKAVLFVDGDLNGDLTGPLWELLLAAQFGVDLALMDCYVQTTRPREGTTAGQVYAARLELNRSLRRPDLGVAIPSHGPCAASRRLLLEMPIWSLGMPPVLQALAAQAGLRVEVSARMPHRALGSAPREALYRKQVAHTIIADCVAAKQAAAGQGLPSRSAADPYIGLSDQRRFDLLGLVPSLGVPQTSACDTYPVPAGAPAPAAPPAAAPDAPPRRRRRRRKSPASAVGTIASQAAPSGQGKRGGREHAGDGAHP